MDFFIAILLLVAGAGIMALCDWAKQEWQKEMANWPRHEDRHEPDDDDNYCKDMDAL